MSILHPIGAQVQADGSCQFYLWGSTLETVSVEIQHPKKTSIPLKIGAYGYRSVTLPNAATATTYFFKLNNDLLRPDLVSLSQPNGVHKESALVNHYTFSWTDQNWKGLPLEQYLIYELHTGTF